MNTDIKRPLDRITEAYKGNMGEDFSKKTRERINWIVNNVKGSKVLDVGCSQGIVPIILGREGKQVDAIDIARESIEYANLDLRNEHTTVQENVTFKISNFMTDQELDVSYETILLTEVLEHISDPYSFLCKIKKHLIEDGRLVVTVPFGINDYFDHKRTYYFLDLFEQLSTHFSIEEIEYLGKWVGVICKKNKEKESFSKGNSFSQETIKRLEKAFYIVERELLNRIENFQQNIRDKNDYINRLQNQHREYIGNLKNQVSQRDDQIKTLNYKINELNDLNHLRVEEINEEKATNRKLLEQIKEQNIELKYLTTNIDNQHRRYLETFEKQFLEKEKDILNLKQQLRTLQSNINTITDEIVSKSKQVEDLKMQNEELNVIKQLHSSINELKSKITNKQEIDQVNNEKTEGLLLKIKEKDNMILQLTKQVDTLKNELLSSLESEENVLQNSLKEKEKLSNYEISIKKLENKISTLERRYLALKNSKLGSFTLKYWQLRRKYSK
ncbi:methyltransferase domain-containing protein [Bacillus sp. J33]|uniref:methyltransferase domain-containing protein n=1 Tax=Bacillus sp. J33 TaxID=935836 RepID=UPI0004BAF52A|nr:methyltransferase domain-containing protein [Bacillus sp. J33]